MERNKTIVKTSIIGILANIFLASFKAVAGVISGSIAIVLDAVNNLSDALSSVITIIGTKLAGKKPDRQHPYGYGRIEYLSAVIISAIILYAGITSLIESIKKIITPTLPDYTIVSIVIISVAVVVKILLGTYVRKVGEKVNSDSLIASGKDATMDSIISASTLVAALIFILFKFSIEAYLGALISLFIIKSGFGILSESISDILGERVDSEFSKEIKRTIAEFEDVHGVYDLIMHNYGPDTYIGSVHIEVPDTYTMEKLDELERSIFNKVFTKHKVLLTGISIYCMNTKDEEFNHIITETRRIVFSHSKVIQMHGFYLNKQDKKIGFDIIIDYTCEDMAKEYEAIKKEMQEEFSDYEIKIILDADMSD